MELKFRRLNSSVRATKCSNRTFMELKLNKFMMLNNLSNVLIVPLWN